MAGKVALITSSAGGLGKAFAEALLKKGAKVCLSDVNVEEGEKTLKEMTRKYGTASAIFVACDVTKEEDMEKLFSETKKVFGNIDVVCNNAGISIEPTNWELVVDTNLKGVIRGTMLAFKYMGKESGGSGGVVVNIASIAGLYPFPGAPVYAATKHGIVGLTRSYGEDVNFAQYGVRVNCICPAFVDTNLCKTPSEKILHFDVLVNQMKEQGDLICPETVAEVFLQLVEDESKNGETALVRLKKETDFIQPPVLVL